MIALAKSADWISPEEYLEGEKVAEVRHEYVDGQVYAMAGTTKAHGRIAGNLFRRLGNHLDGHRCEPFGNDIKVRIPPQIGNLFYYPDVVVTCADEGADDEYYLNQPAIVVEADMMVEKPFFIVSRAAPHRSCWPLLVSPCRGRAGYSMGPSWQDPPRTQECTPCRAR